MHVITVTSYKGGVGKSTTALHLANYFSKKAKTLLVDGDPNRSSLRWFEKNHNFLESIKLRKDLNEAAKIRAIGKMKFHFAVAGEKQATRLVPKYEVIIIDTPARPASDDMKELSEGCDLLILPTSPDVVSLEPMIDTANDLRSMNSAINFKALITMAPPHPNEDAKAMQLSLIDQGIPVFSSFIRRTVGFTDAAFYGVAVDNVKDSKKRLAGFDYQNVAKEIEEGLDA